MLNKERFTPLSPGPTSREFQVAGAVPRLREPGLRRAPGASSRRAMRVRSLSPLGSRAFRRPGGRRAAFTFPRSTCWPLLPRRGTGRGRRARRASRSPRSASSRSFRSSRRRSSRTVSPIASATPARLTRRGEAARFAGVKHGRMVPRQPECQPEAVLMGSSSRSNRLDSSVNRRCGRSSASRQARSGPETRDSRAESMPAPARGSGCSSAATRTVPARRHERHRRVDPVPLSPCRS